jgi:dTDP-4-dehydrorhamnose 3,5-epimerase
MIEGTIIRPLKRNVDERGYLVELMRTDWEDIYPGFAMSYMSLTYPGVIRAWHRHPRTKQRDTFAVLQGMAKVVIYDPDTDEINEHFIGENNPVLLSFDGSKWHGFKAVGDKPCLLLNFPDKLYDYKNPDEERLPYNTDKIPYNWDIVMK